FADGISTDYYFSLPSKRISTNVRNHPPATGAFMHTPSTHVLPVDMSKHRLELFSDGIYAIILTLLVLDLKVPAADGLPGLKQATPALLVHALTFFVISGMWLTHHSVFALLHELNAKIIRLNLVGMFWVTLIPFGARIASEEPLGSLGAFMIT